MERDGNAGTHFAVPAGMTQKRKHPDTDIEQAANEQSRRLQPGTGSPMPKPAGRRGGKVHRSTAAMKKGRREPSPD
jgi:hypothetical protein